MGKNLFTAENYLYDKAPEKIDLLGDKTKKREKGQHIIEFPGGAIEVSRTSDGQYWAHIIINRVWADKDQKGMNAKLGEIAGSIIMSDNGPIEIPDSPHITQISVLIKPVED
jgi:hypothetical protein